MASRKLLWTELQIQKVFNPQQKVKRQQHKHD